MGYICYLVPMFSSVLSTSLSVLLPLSSLLLGVQAAEAKLPANYVEQPASIKRDILWENIKRQPYSLSDLPSENPGALELLQLLATPFLKVSFTHSQDEMPVGRKKLIHTYGSSAKVRLEVEASSPFTGLFESGGTGIARLSLATHSGDFTPGIGLKILVDGKPSKNFQVMYSLDGQGKNRNFFANTMTNIVAPPRAIPLKILANAFALALKFLSNAPENERTLPLQEAASVTASGATVESPVVPYQILFKPEPAIQTAMSREAPSDLRVQLSHLVEGSSLYAVWLKESSESAPVYIGRLILESPFIASAYEDESLFFQHQRRL